MISETDYKDLVHFVKKMPLSAAKVNVIASVLHAGQTDIGGNDYMEHLQFVAEESCRLFRSINSAIPDKDALNQQYAVGMLHDSIEDVTIQGAETGEIFRFYPEGLVNMGIPKSVIDPVIMLTKKHSNQAKSPSIDKSNPIEAWGEYRREIEHLLGPKPEGCSPDSFIRALCAKIADNRHNKDLSRLPSKHKDKPRYVSKASVYSISEAFLLRNLSNFTNGQI